LPGRIKVQNRVDYIVWHRWNGSGWVFDHILCTKCEPVLDTRDKMMEEYPTILNITRGYIL
jgi:hypothetical protein